MARLAGGVVLAGGQAAWAPGPDGLPVRQGRGIAAAAGTPVAVGPADAADIALKAALDELDRLVAAGGASAAGAGVDLGGGFRSALLAGAAGERRDWVLAALKVLWPDGAGRLGERAAVVAGLFGPTATRRLGAALNRAADEGHWAAIDLAVAASDLLGPERLERVLALEAPEGTDPVPGGEPSILAGFLAEVLGPFTEARRLALLQSLWERVVATQLAGAAAHRQRQRWLTAQHGDDAVETTRACREEAEDDWIVGLVTDHYRHRPTLAEAARWIPSRKDLSNLMGRALDDALAATALARLAVAATDGPLEAVLAEHLDRLIQGACPAIKGTARSQLRRLRGTRPEAGRPGHVVAEIAAAAVLAAQPGAGRPVQIRGAVLHPGRLEDFVRTRLATARAHGIVALDRVELLYVIGPTALPSGTTSPPSFAPGARSPDTAPSGRRTRGSTRPTARPARRWPSGSPPTRPSPPTPSKPPRTCCGSPIWATPSLRSTAIRRRPSPSSGEG